MKKSLIALAVMALCAPALARRSTTHDAAIKYRMDAGYPGDINRTHPFSVLPAQADGTTPPRRYGDPIIFGTNTIRGFVAGDTAVTKLRGVLVRPYPVSQTSGGMSASFGAATPPGANSVLDYIEDGFVMVKVDNIGAGAPSKGSAVFVWCAASAGNDVQGGFRCAASAGNTAAIANAEFNGPADANGVAEIRIWK
jgi:hypothetical protein